MEMLKVVYILSAMLFLVFLSAAVVGCYSIYKAAKQGISQSGLSLTHRCLTKKLESNTEQTGAPLQNDSSGCSLEIKVSPVSGSSSFRQTGDHTSTFSQTDSSNMDGLHQRGIKSLVRDVLNTQGPEQVLLGLGPENADSVSMQQSIPLKESKKKCQACIRIRKALGVGGA